MSIFSKIFRPRNATSGSAYSFFMGQSTAGKRVNERTSMETAAVYACVRVLAEAVASLPIHLYHIDSDGNKEKALDHPLYRILAKEPNEEMTHYVFMETLMLHLLIWGNAYAQIIRNGRGQVLGLYPLMPDRVKVDRDEKKRLYYEYTVSEDDAKTIRNQDSVVKLRKEDVLHVPGLSFDGLVGYSPIAMAKNTIGLSVAAQEYASKLFANGATPSGILSHPGVLKDSSKLRESWQSTFGGSQNAGRVAVLEEGVTYQPVTMKPEEAQFLEIRRFETQEIARIYRVPPHMIGDLEHATLRNVEEQSLEFVKYTLQPWLVRWEEEIERLLLTPAEKGEYFVKFNLNSLLRGDSKSRFEGYRVGVNSGIYSVNDVRQLEDMDLVPDSEGGNVHMANGNCVKLSEIGIAYQRQGSGNETEDDRINSD